MEARQSLLSSPARVVGAALAVILLFGLLYPFVGGISERTSESGTAITYRLSPSDLSEAWLVAIVLPRGLELSLQAFTLNGSPLLRPVGAARYLAHVESLLGMGFVALLTASLIREAQS